MLTTPRRGFVLLEAVVALAILGVASIVLLQVRAQQMRVASQARELLTAQALAEDRLGALRLLNHVLLEDPPDSLMRGVFPPPFETFSWSAEVELIEDEYDLFGLEVVVEGPDERFPLRTLVHRPRSVLVSSGLEGAGGMPMGGTTGGRPGGQGGGQGMPGTGPGGASGGTGETRRSGGQPGGASGGTGETRRSGGQPGGVPGPERGRG
jgi:type II secretory pathway pseudopilin PulG